MKLSQWAKKQGIHYKTAWRLWKTKQRLIVMETTEMKDDLVQHTIDVLTSFCARLYGKRSAKNRVKKALKEIEKC